MKRFKPIYLMALAMSFAACQKDKSLDDKHVYHKNDGAHSSEDTIGVVTIHTLSDGSIFNDPCVQVVNNTLIFSSHNCFANFYKSIINRSSADLDNWETMMGFNSLYSHYAILEQDPHYDDWASDSLRCANHYFERLLNVDQEYIVNDTTFTFDFVNEEMRITDNISLNDTVIHIGNLMFGKTNTSFCASHKGKRVSGTLNNSNYKIKTRKILKRWYSTTWSNPASELYITTRHYKKGFLGIWKKKKVNELVNHIDRWHELDFDVMYTALPGSIASTLYNVNISNRKYVDDDSKEHTTMFFDFYWQEDMNDPWKVLYPCVNKFERFHCYTDSYNDDVHNETSDWW